MRIVLALAVLGAVCFGQARDQKIEAGVAAVKDRVVATRRDFHQHPELSNREERTARVIAERLKSLGFDEVKTGVAKHGVVGLLKGSKPGPVVAWRADMDALPVMTTRTEEFAPKGLGVQHACGHDGHVAIALGAAEVLSKMRDEIKGTVKFVFQPAEEGAPVGEEGGAALMIKEGVLENPKVQAIFGLHVGSDIPVGKVSYVPGAALASADTFKITLRGKQVHGAMPHLGNDTIVIAAQCIQSLQTIRSRRIDPGEPMVLTLGSIHGGNRHNIITGEVVMQGTLRTLNEQVRETSRTMMRQTLEGCTAGSGASYELTYEGPQYPVTENDAALAQESLPAMRKVLGDDLVLGKAIMGAEDFSFYQKLVPGFFWRLGIRNEAKGITAAHHTPDFTLDEDALPVGVKVATVQLLDWLDRHGN